MNICNNNSPRIFFNNNTNGVGTLNYMSSNIITVNNIV